MKGILKLKIILQVVNNKDGEIKVKPENDYNCITTYRDLGYYILNNNFIFYVSSYKNIHDIDKILEFLKNSCSLKWCLLNYKKTFFGEMKWSLNKISHVYLKDRIQIKEELQFEKEIIE